jgi:hypothetical protein
VNFAYSTCTSGPQGPHRLPPTHSKLGAWVPGHHCTTPARDPSISHSPSKFPPAGTRPACLCRPPFVAMGATRVYSRHSGGRRNRETFSTRPPISASAGRVNKLPWRIRIGDYRVIYGIHDDRKVVDTRDPATPRGTSFRGGSGNDAPPQLENVRFSGEHVIVTIDGEEKKIRLTSVSSLLAGASTRERNTFQISPFCYGIHWSSSIEGEPFLINLKVSSYIRLRGPMVTIWISFRTTL